MICDACQERSAVAFCGSCRKMLCEECGTPCSSCGKPTCNDCLTSKGSQVICSLCSTGAPPAKKAPKAITPEGEAPDEEAIPAAPRREIDPGLVSLAVGAIVVILTGVMVAWQRIISWQALVIGAVGAIIGIVGMFAGNYKAVAGFVLNLVPFLVMLVFQIPYAKPTDTSTQIAVDSGPITEEEAQKQAYERQQRIRSEYMKAKQPPPQIPATEKTGE